MIGDVPALIKTLLDIIRLRKGPDAIPRSGVLLAIVIFMWFAADFTVIALVDGLDQADFVVGVLTSVVGLGCYGGVLILTDKATRILQTVTAIIGCGALLEVLLVVDYVFLKPFIGNEMTVILYFLILFWSVRVDGHIIARAANQHWYFGIIIAVAVFVLQYYLSMTINPMESAAA